MTSSPIFFLTLLLAGARTEEVATPSNLLGPKNFNHHPFEAGQYLKELTRPEPTKKGPVLFPNDAPSARRPPLVVTSRPLIESIARSELNPNPPENSQNTQNNEHDYNAIAEQSQQNRVQYKPGFLTPKSYQNFNYDPASYVTPNSIGPTPVILVNAITGKPVQYPGDYEDYPTGYKNPYAGVVKKVRLLNQDFGGDNRFTDYEEKTILPPIYKALSDHAKQKVLKLKNSGQKYNNFEVKEPVHSSQYQSNHLDDEQSDYSQDSNYAFSYKVKDQKTGDDFSHSQQSSGSATNGEYRVRLPDGRMQIVSYTADENGYKADVRYDDEDKTAGNNINYDYVNNNNNNGQRINHDYSNPKQSDHNINNQNYNVAATVATQQQHYDYNSQNAYNQDYTNNRRYKVTPAPVKEDYENVYPDAKDYDTEDYSLEYSGKNNNYQSHKSKFSDIVEPKSIDQNKVRVIVVPNPEDTNQQANLRPSIEELRRLYLDKDNIQPVSDHVYNNIPIEINVPSTTPRPNQYESTTEHVVLIGGSNKPNLYTNIRSSVAPSVSTPSPLYFSTPNFLGSSVGPYSKNIDFSGPKPVLSSRFIDKINRYLTFK